MRLTYLVIAAAIICLPLTSLAVDTGKIVPCDGVEVRCTFAHLFVLASNIITFFVNYVAAPLAAVMFVIAGIYYMRDGGSGKSVSKAKDIFMTTLIGLFLVLVSYLIVKAILYGLLSNSNTTSGRGLLEFFNKH
jgi:hypothetical protein